MWRKRRGLYGRTPWAANKPRISCENVKPAVKFTASWLSGLGGKMCLAYCWLLACNYFRRVRHTRAFICLSWKWSSLSYKVEWFMTVFIVSGCIVHSGTTSTCTCWWRPVLVVSCGHCFETGDMPLLMISLVVVKNRLIVCQLVAYTIWTDVWK